MRLLLLGILAIALLFAGCGQKAEQKAPDAMEKPPGETMEKPPEAMENKSGAAMENESAANESDAEDAPEDTVVVVEMPEEPEVPVVRFDVTAKDYTYTPSNFTVKKGSRVRFSITAVDRSYGFAIMDYGVSELIMVGQTKVVSFIADKPGTFEIKNTHITSGAARDMRGTLVVEE